MRNMVVFTRETIERELTPEELEKERLRLIEHSPEWQRHASIHQKSGWGKAQLHITGEPVLGETEDAVRTRFGLQKPRETAQPAQTAAEQITYGIQHGKEHVTYAGANIGDRPGLWATCNCGAEFKMGQGKDNKPEIKSYGIVGTDSASTQYAVSSGDSTYKATETFSGYTTKEKPSSYA